MFVTTLEAEQRASLHQGKDTPCSGATQGMMPSFLRNFSKNPDNCVESNRTSERFFDGRSISRKVKMTTCVERGVAARSKLLVLTPPRLQHEDLRALLEFPGFHPISFQKYSSDRRDSGPKKMISQAKPRQVTSRTFRVLGGCERVIALSGLRRPGLPTPTPSWLQSEAWSLRFSKLDCVLL
jgi:hypothetical protein